MKRGTASSISRGLFHTLHQYRDHVFAAVVSAAYWALAFALDRAVRDTLPMSLSVVIVYSVAILFPAVACYYFYRRTRKLGVVVVSAVTYVLSFLIYGNAYWSGVLLTPASFGKAWTDLLRIAGKVYPGPLGIIAAILGVMALLGLLFGFYILYYLSVVRSVRFAIEVLTFERSLSLKDVRRIAAMYLLTALWFTTTFWVVETLVGRDIFLIEHKTWRLVDLFYISMGTITAYSDAVPLTWYAKLLTLLEVLAGQFIVVIVLAMCFAGVVRKRS
jgi:hypothetical protein